jgi:hypothetical protein
MHTNNSIIAALTFFSNFRHIIETLLLNANKTKTAIFARHSAVVLTNAALSTAHHPHGSSTLWNSRTATGELFQH